jgi:AcrR family transcriptional regulator
MSKGTETRNRIITKAAALFNRKGYEGCSMQDIVEAVGLEKGSLYGHFRNKEELAVAAFRFAWGETSTTRIAGMDKVDHAIDKLRLHVRNAVASPSFSGGCPLLNTIVDSDDGNSILKREARAALKGWRNYLEGIVRVGQSRGEVRADIAPESVVSVLISLLEGAMLLDRVDRPAGNLKVVKEHIGGWIDSLAVQSH